MVQINGNSGRILITGASGFVGRALINTLKRKGQSWIAAVRKPQFNFPGEHVVVGDIGPNTDWRQSLPGVDCVVHLAARTHVTRETATDKLTAYRHINVAGTKALALAAADAGVRRIVFVSSIKAVGEQTTGCLYSENTIPQPEDAYGISKYEAELALAEIAWKTGIEIVVLRPPLVYGPGVKGNFLTLMRLVARGVPLPLASVANRRSLIYVGNLVDALITCIESPRAAGRTYLLSDGEDVSTSELIRGIGAALEVPSRLFRCPLALLRCGAGILGKGEEIRRLTGSLQINASKIRSELGWIPHLTLDHGLAQTARWYHSKFD